MKHADPPDKPTEKPTEKPPVSDAKHPVPPLALLYLLRAYVSDDDVELTKNQFLRAVADRINEDLAGQQEP